MKAYPTILKTLRHQWQTLFPALVIEELHSDLHRLEARLQRLETRNGLNIETLKESPLALGGNEKLVEDPMEEKVTENDLCQLELKVRDAVSIGETQPEDLPDEQDGLGSQEVS